MENKTKLSELITNKELTALGLGGNVKLWQLRRAGKLPFMRFGRKIFYNPAAIIELMQVSGNFEINDREN